jgi:pyruvate/2-oxoacid:ferredoxin oxidoreductase beta subunit
MAEITKLVHKYLRHDKKFPHVWCPGCGNGIVLGAMIRAIDRLAYRKVPVGSLYMWISTPFILPTGEPLPSPPG